MTYAVIEMGSKQYPVEIGDLIEVELLDTKAGGKLTIDKVMLLSDRKGEVQIGTPYLKSVKVKAKVLEHGKEDKKKVFKYKNKTGYRVKRGHRQDFSSLEILDIVTKEPKAKEKGEEQSGA